MCTLPVRMEMGIDSDGRPDDPTLDGKEGLPVYDGIGSHPRYMGSRHTAPAHQAQYKPDTEPAGNGGVASG